MKMFFGIFDNRVRYVEAENIREAADMFMLEYNTYPTELGECD